MPKKIPCRLCNKPTARNLKLAWLCLKCQNENIPFSECSDLELNLMLSGKHNSNFNYETLDCPSHLKALFKDLNGVSNTITNCKYFNVDDFNRSIDTNVSLFLHQNIISLPYHIDDLRNLIFSMNSVPEVIAITETGLNSSDTNITNIEITGFNYEHTATTSKRGGALLYLNSDLTYKTRNELTIYKPKELESVFVEILNPQSANTIVGCIYRHPSMCIKEFNTDYLTPLLEKLSLENKNIVLLGDYNIDLLHYGDSKDTSNYLELMTSSSFFPFITLPTRITSKSKTLIDNIFLNFHSPDITSGNLTTSISDHMTQFLALPNKTKQKYKTTSKIKKRC